MGIAGKEQAGTVNGISEVAHQGVTEIFRRNTTTGSVRQTVEILELRARDNAMRVEGKIYYRDILATGSMSISIYLSHLPMAKSSTENPIAQEYTSLEDGKSFGGVGECEGSSLPCLIFLVATEVSYQIGLRHAKKEKREEREKNALSCG